jgi:hypothetical protein
MMLVVSRLVSRLFDFGALLVLARLLTPQDFGTVAIAMSLMQVDRGGVRIARGPSGRAGAQPRTGHARYHSRSACCAVLFCGGAGGLCMARALFSGNRRWCR